MPILRYGSIPIQTIWDYVYGLLASQTNVGVVNGEPAPGKGTNSSGKLQSIVSVGHSTWPNFNALPFVGVDPPSASGRPYAAPRRDMVDLKIKIAAALSIQAQSEDTLLLEDAWRALVPIVDDGNGNGIQPILRSDVTLGGNAIQSIITEIQIGWDQRPGSGSAYIAWADMTVVATVEAQGSQ